MAEEDEELFSHYMRGIARKPEIEDEEDATEYRTMFEDITQETHPWGAISEIYRTADNIHQQKRKKARYGDLALIVRRIAPVRENDRTPVKVQLELQSETLCAAFAGIAAKRVNINLHQRPIIIPEPYVELHHCQEALTTLAEQGDVSPVVQEELQLLVQFQRDYMAQQLTNLYSFVDNGLITFKLIPFIFKPGTLIIVPNRLISSSEVQWCAMLEQCHIIENPDKKASWEVHILYTSFNNDSFGTVSRTIEFPSFGEVMQITDLPVYPLEYHPDADIFDMLVRRGNRFMDLCSTPELPSCLENDTAVNRGSHCHYKGPFWEVPDDEKQSGSSMSTLDVFRKAPSSQTEGRVVVDPLGFSLEDSSFCDEIRSNVSGPGSLVLDPSIQVGEGMFKQSLPGSQDVKTTGQVASPREGSDITNMQLATLAPIIASFSLTMQCWGFLLVDQLTDIQWRENAYDNLQLDQRRKDAIRTLVSQHRLGPRRFDDIISGKGRGLVFLLYGPPGSGKTMTAETIAESLNCPLYYTTGGELGLETDEIDWKLRLIFQRIQRWGAILLFDEADISMAKRTEDHLERNALVSILLRKLEYQSGILFLTTNRAEDFDSAFYSRIHVQIAFSKPDRRCRTFIWKSLAAKVGHTVTEDEFDELGSLSIDGRRIKNVIKVASLLMSGTAEQMMSFENIRDALIISAGNPADKEEGGAISDFCTSRGWSTQ